MFAAWRRGAGCLIGNSRLPATVAGQSRWLLRHFRRRIFSWIDRFRAWLRPRVRGFELRVRPIWVRAQRSYPTGRRLRRVSHTWDAIPARLIAHRAPLLTSTQLYPAVATSPAANSFQPAHQDSGIKRTICRTMDLGRAMLAYTPCCLLPAVVFAPLAVKTRMRGSWGQCFSSSACDQTV